MLKIDSLINTASKRIILVVRLNRETRQLFLRSHVFQHADKNKSFPTD